LRRGAVFGSQLTTRHFLPVENQLHFKIKLRSGEETEQPAKRPVGGAVGQEILIFRKCERA
jgi:hypothetical protein